jgi:hydroxymethylpyrimidine/phosphomethylpyrimidine kinase
VLRAGGGGRLGKDEVGYAARTPAAAGDHRHAEPARSRILAELPEGTADECAENCCRSSSTC